MADDIEDIPFLVLELDPEPPHDPDAAERARIRAIVDRAMAPFDQTSEVQS